MILGFRSNSMEIHPPSSTNMASKFSIASISRAGGSIPHFKLNASLGADIYKSERLNMKFQVDGLNLTNVLEVIDFGGLFSGNAIGPSRSFALRLSSTF